MPSNQDDVIDSREVITRIEELESQRDSGVAFDADDSVELAALTDLRDQAEPYASDWTYGVTLVRDDYFTDYVQQWVDDLGALRPALPSYIVIDWDATAANFQQDYTAVDFAGVTYWVQ